MPKMRIFRTLVAALILCAGCTKRDVGQTSERARSPKASIFKDSLTMLYEQGVRDLVDYESIHRNPDWPQRNLDSEHEERTRWRSRRERVLCGHAGVR